MSEPTTSSPSQSSSSPSASPSGTKSTPSSPFPSANSPDQPSPQQDHQKIKQSYKQFKTKLHKKLLKHELLTQYYFSFKSSLQQLSDIEKRTLSQNRYKEEYKFLEPLVHSPTIDPNVVTLMIGQYLHRKCQNPFDKFALCNFKKQVYKKNNKEKEAEQINCQKDINQYVSCVEKFGNKFIMSSLTTY